MEHVFFLGFMHLFIYIYVSSCTIFLKDEDEHLRSFKKMQLNAKANHIKHMESQIDDLFLKNIYIYKWKKKYLLATSMKE